MNLIGKPDDSVVNAVVNYRNQRVRDQLSKRDYAAVLLYDPVNIRYATNTSNMQVWCLHNSVRYALILREGPTILFEFPRAAHLLEQQVAHVDEVREPTMFQYMVSGQRMGNFIRRWTDEICDILQQYAGDNRRLAIDRLDPAAVFALSGSGIEVKDGQEVMEQARCIKSDEELLLVRYSMAVCEQAMNELRESIQPGITEQALWSRMHQRAIEAGGEWFETRLLTTGERTNPWYQECGDHLIAKGDMIALDTDFVGPFGYCSDVSRSWVCDAKPTNTQYRLYNDAYDLLQRNMQHLKAGLSFKEFSELCGNMPDNYATRRYTVLAHGIGLSDEYPFIPFKDDMDKYGVDDNHFQENMTVCIEAYIGEDGGKEGVKLEEQVLITPTGVERISLYPYEHVNQGH